MRIPIARGSVTPSLCRAALRSGRAAAWLLGACLIAVWISVDASLFEARGISAALFQQPPAPPSVPAAGRSFAVYATGTACGAISMGGGAFVDSFDSSRGTYAETRTQGQARVGVNGNINLSGSKTIVYGRIFALNTNVGSCKNGVPGITLSGGAQVIDGYVRLPSPPVFPNPAAVNPGSQDYNVSNDLTLAPGNYGRIAISGGATLTLSAGTYTINSLALSGGSVLATPPSGQVIVNLAGVKVSQPVNMSGGTLQNLSGIPLNFQLIYGGSQSLVVSGGAMAYGVIYAPNAGVKLSGGGEWFGAMTVKTLDNSGGSPLHYDRGLIVPPTITTTVTPAPNANGWHNANAAVSFACSGPLGIASCPSPVTVTTEGQDQIVSGTVTDFAGATATATVTLNIDKTPPVVTAAASPSANSSGWNKTPVAIHFTCADSGSGIASCGPDVQLTTEGMNRTASGTATDRAGNTASVTSAGVNIDLTPPVVVVTSPANGSVVSASPAMLTGTVSDALSGVSGVACNGQPAAVNGGSFQCAVPLAQGNNPISVVAADVAGNTNTAPWGLTFTPTDGQLTLTISEPANGAIVAHSPVIVRGTVSDPTARVIVQSVLARVTGQAFEAQGVALVEGTNQLLARARDDEGGQATATRSITLDTVAPVLDIGSPPEREVLTSRTISIMGTVADATAVTCSVGGAAVTVTNGNFIAPATLSAATNVFTVTCQDAAGNVSTRSRTLYFAESRLAINELGPPNGATDVSPAASIAVTFSRPVDPSSVSAATVLISAGGAVLPATLSVSADGLVVTAIPLVPLPPGTLISVVVTAGVVGADGTPLPSPFVSRFTTSGTAPAPTVFAGEAYDDSRGQPLQGAIAQAVEPATAEPLATVETDERGRFLLNPGRAGVFVRVSKTGFAPVIRTDASPQGALAHVFDARLTPLGAPQTVNALFGGSIKNSTGDALAIRPGSLAADSPITFTSISEQAPRLLFPQGWSPLSVVDIVSPAAFRAPVGLSLVDRSGAAAGRTAVVARFDEPSTQWVAILAATIPPVGPIEVENVTSAGQYALLIADSGDGGPAAPSAGQPLESAAAVPVPLNATGAGTVTPEVGRADDTTPAGAVVTVTASTPLRSGSQLRGDFMELFVMRDGRPVAPLDTSQDFIGYRVPSDSSGTSLAAHFPITASRTFGATELSEGTITVSMFRSSLASQSLIGTNGGGVESSDGSRMIAPAGAFAANVPVQLRRVDTATFQLTTPPGTSLVGVLDLDLSGQTSATPLTLSLAGGASLAPTGSQVIVAELRDVRSRERLVFVTLANVDGSGLTTRTTIDALTVPGVRSGGRYVFLRFDGALALVTGTARDAGGRRDGHLTEIEQFPLVSVTGATGAFVLASPAGSFSLLATAAASLDQIRVQGTTGVALPEIVIGISPPRVESIVVRTPRIEGNFAGPVVLLGKPAPIVDDDGNGQSSGNGNGQVDAGERIELTLSVRNDGSVAVNSGAFALSVRGPAGPIAALPASIPVSSLAPDAATPIGPFVFEVPAGTNTALLQYTITFLTNAGVSNAIPFRLPLRVDHWNVSTGSEITIRFSEPVVVPDGAARLEKEDGGTFAPVETRLLTDEGGDVVVLRPLSPLAQESVYRITLTGAIVDADGRALQSAPVVERFRTEDRTPPPPIGAGKISASVPDAEGFVTITATLGSLNPDDVVILLNETTGFTVLVTIAADGSFSGRLRAELSDQLVILVRDRNGNETRADPGPLLRRDPVTGAILSAVLGPAGGTVVSGDGIRLIVPAGALPGATELSVSRVPGTSTLPSDLAGNASVAAAFQSRFTFADRFRIDGALHQFLTPVKVALSAPAGAPPGTLFLVVRRRMVTVDGPLADIDTMTGIPGSERPQRTVERLEIVESATVKEKAGQPIVSTDSPPFEGITESGEFELIRVTSGQVFFAGEVRRDSPTGPLVAGAVVSSLPEVLATSPFVDVTDSSGRFIVAGDATVEELLVAGTTVTSRLDATDPDFRRVIRRDVRGIVGPPAPANTTIAHLIEPFVLPAALPEALIEALGDIEPPRIDIQISSPSFQNGLSRAGDPLTVTVAATDNDAVEFVALELVDGTSSQAVALDADGTATLTPTTDSLLTFRAQARDRHDNSTFVDRLVRVVSAVIGQPLIPGTMTGAPVVIGSSETNVAFDGDIEIRFSEPLDPRTVTTAAVQLRREGPTIPVDFDIELLFGGTLLRIIPKRNLSFGVCYLVDLSSQIRDMSGEELQQQSFVITTQRPIQVATVSLPFTEDVALAGEVLVAINHPRNSGVGDFGAIHTFRVRDDAGELLPQPVPLAPADGVKTTGRPLSLAVDGNVAFVGNRFLGAIATQQPQLSTFIPGTTSVIPDTVLGCSVEPTMVTVCQGLSSQWANFPQPPSNLEAFSLADPTLPTRVAARVINFLGTSHDTEIWNPNTWPDRVEVTDQGIAVLNFGDNLEFFAHDARLSSKGVIGRVRRYGEVVSELEISDAAYLDGSAVIAHRGGVTLVATDIVDDPLVREEVVELDSVQSSDAFGARVGAVRRFQWTDPTGIRRAADLAFVAARGAGLSIYDVSALTLAPLGVLPGVFGNMSFDSCRGLAYVHGLNGAFHVIDFNDPTRPVDLNDGASPFTVQSLGSALNFNGNANAYGVVYLAGEGGIAMVRMPASGSFGRSCAAAPATTASSNTTSASFAPTALAMQTLTSASTGVSSPFSGPTSAKFRARVACRECQTPALKLPDDPVYSLPPGLGWTGEVEVTPNEGLVLRNVALHQLWSPPSDDVGRKMLTTLSVPFVQYKTNSDPEFESRLCPTNIPGCVSRLVSFQAPTVVVTRTNDEIVRKIVTEAEYLVGATDDATSCLRVIQRYEFTHELDPNVRGNPMCEPTESTWLAPLRTGLTCAKFIPTVSYEFVTSDPAITLQSVNVPQRAQFDVDGASANAVALFHDCEPFDDSSDCRFPIVGKFPLDTVGVQTGWLLDALSTIPTLLPVTAPLSVLVRFGVPGVGVFRDENPLRLETYNTVIDRGVAVRPLIDNFHQTSNTKIQLPLPPPGCEECVHLHWRWFRCALEIAGRGCVDPIDDDFMGGEPLIPDGSKQSLDVAVLNATVNDVDVIRGAIQRAAGSGSYRTTLNALSESPVLWRVARWARDSEPDSKGTFFSMQPIFFTSRP